MTNIILHGIGGAGINITAEAYEKFGSYHKVGFSKLKPNFLDTSDANILPIEKLGMKLHKVVSTKASVEEIAGSGSERSSNVMDAKVSVKKYLDDIDVTKDSPSDIHLVIFSGSGGSGSSAGVLLIRELLLKDCAVCAVMVGDNDNLLYAINTTKTLESLAGVSKVTKKILTTYYVNNSYYKGTMSERLQDANNVVLGFIYSLLVMTADSNKELDKADVRALFKQSYFKTINIPNGLSFIEDTGKGNIDDKEGCSITLVRTITDSLENSVEVSNALHSKVGIITNEDIISDAEEHLPISLSTYSGCLTPYLKYQNNKVEELKELEESIAKDDIEFNGDDETGLVF